MCTFLLLSITLSDRFCGVRYIKIFGLTSITSKVNNYLHFSIFTPSPMTQDFSSFLQFCLSLKSFWFCKLKEKLDFMLSIMHKTLTGSNRFSAISPSKLASRICYMRRTFCRSDFMQYLLTVRSCLSFKAFWEISKNFTR